MSPVWHRPPLDPKAAGGRSSPDMAEAEAMLGLSCQPPRSAVARCSPSELRETGSPVGTGRIRICAGISNPWPRNQKQAEESSRAGFSPITEETKTLATRVGKRRSHHPQQNLLTSRKSKGFDLTRSNHTRKRSLCL
ncbi:hypothetical protein C8034_v007083 [Colletotrichum sidae]|uniref:Uncharacterized protein n=1 Tax=Colletotrichum sidae TaxID=1347389 RepID=A0A4R8T3X1_9PEZI|nr:hypothetical protein C8034_v007083 [Colletotrichum sidae]